VGPEAGRYQGAARSEAVTTFLGWERFDQPQQDADAVRDRFGPNEAKYLLEFVINIVVEADTLHEEFPDVPVVPSESLLRELMESRHPELNSEAISAICWYYSYNWR